MKAMLPLRPESRKRVEAEAKKAVDDYLIQRCLDLDTVVMWILHRRFGFGAERCKRFYDQYKPTVGEFRDRYDDGIYMKMREDLSRDGIELKKWQEEKNDAKDDM